MLTGPRMLLLRRRGIFAAVFFACLGFGSFTALFFSRSSIASMTFEASQPLERSPALDDQSAALFGKYLDRFRDIPAQAACLEAHGFPVDKAFLQDHIELKSEMQGGCRFHFRVSGSRTGFVLLVAETLGNWFTEESARLLQEHTAEMRVFQEGRLKVVMAESAKMRERITAMEASLHVGSLPDSLKKTDARLDHLRENLAATEISSRRLLKRISVRSKSLSAAATKSARKKQSRGRLPPAIRRGLALVNALSKTARQLEAKKVSLKGSILKASKFRLQILERKDEYDELSQQKNAYDSAASMWTKMRDFTIFQQQSGIGKLSITAGPKLVETGFSLFRLDVFLGIGFLASILALASTILADYFDTTVRNPFFMPHVRSFNIIGKITEVMPAGETILHGPNEPPGAPGPSEPPGPPGPPGLIEPAFMCNPLIPLVASEDCMASLRDQILPAVDRIPLNEPSMAPAAHYPHSEGRKHFVTIILLSPKPGAGASTITVGLGLSLARAGRRVLLVDADQRAPTLHKMLFVPKFPGLTSWVPGKTLDSCCMETGFDRLRIIPAGLQHPDLKRFWGSGDWVGEFLETSQMIADIVLVDVSPLSVCQDAGFFLRHADRILVLAGVGSSRVVDVHAAFSFLNENNFEPAGIIYNRIPQGEIDFMWRMV